MSSSSAHLPNEPTAPELPEVTLQVRHGSGQPISYPVEESGFVIGSVPGCDLRVPGANLPPVICVLQRQPDGVILRKLAPMQPILLNDQPVATTNLCDGDRVRIGTLELLASIKSAPPRPINSGAVENQAEDLNAAWQELHDQSQEFQQDLAQFEQQREAFENDYKRKRKELTREQHELRKRLQAPPDLIEREKDVERRAAEIETRVADLDHQREDLATMRQELADIRRQLYNRYQERRDRLSGLQEAVNRAARKVQERKREVDAEILSLSLRQQEAAKQEAVQEDRAAELTRRSQEIEEERLLLIQRGEALHKEFSQRLAACREREQETALRHQKVGEAQEQYQADLVRLDRFRGELNEREQQLQERAAALAEQEIQLQAERENAREEAGQLDAWHIRLRAMAEQLAEQKQQLEAEATRLAQRSTTIEGQQAMLANLRSRVEQWKEEIRTSEVQIVEDRARLQEHEENLQQQAADIERQTAQLVEEKSALAQERQQVLERGEVMEEAVGRLREAQEKLEQAEQELEQSRRDVEARATAQQEKDSELAAKETEFNEVQQKLDTDRQAVLERMQLLAQAEKARETLQEQLRRRSEELSERQRILEEQIVQHKEGAETLAEQRAEFERQHEEANERMNAHRKEIETKAEVLSHRFAELQQREATLGNNKEKLKQQGQSVAAQKKSLQEQQEEAKALRSQTEEAAAQARAEFEAAKREAVGLHQRLPDLELRAGTIFERLSFAREQLREHINEVHAYAGQCEEDLDAVRTEIQTEGERLQTRDQALRRLQEEQRLALASFRQQMIDWQGHIAEMKRLLAENESRVELKQSRVEQQAKHVGEESTRLAREAEQLQKQQREVADQRTEMTHHLSDMRDWYRRKMRDLAGLDENGKEKNAPVDGARANEEAVPGRDILSLTGEIKTADWKLGEVLTKLGLIDNDALDALLMEACRQRRSLRNVLLASGTVTTYQMNLIEAGNLDAMMMGNVRVIDRLTANTREKTYRVHDPERGRELLLRHLTEEEMQDAVHPDEFCQRFSQAIITHPNVLATVEVQEIDGRPAVLQELPAGLPSSDWPALAGVPGVWFRLLSQAALGLHTAHQAGMVHGHLQSADVYLTADGIVKLRGFGEPPWLAGVSSTETVEETAGDLTALGHIAAEWASPREGRAVKPLPKVLQDIVKRLHSDDPSQQFTTAAELLDALDAISAKVKDNPEAWERLLQHVKQHNESPPRRRTA